MTALGLDVIAEDVTNHGKIDLTVKIEDKIYIIEFKVVEIGGSKNSAFKQIKDKRYHEKYIVKGKDIYLLGVEFSKEDIKYVLAKRGIEKFTKFLRILNNLLFILCYYKILECQT